MINKQHTPVLLTEVLAALNIKPDCWYIDATFGHGGHTEEILNQGGKVLAIDYDQNNILFGKKKFAREITNHQLILTETNFEQLTNIIAANITPLSQKKIKGILFDFGTTAEQLTSVESGLSFQGKNSELDMRIDKNLGVKAKDLLAIMNQKQLQQIFSEYGGEREARKISQAIVTRRLHGSYITNVAELVDLITTTKKHFSKKIHSATKVFQALRIAVNDELGNINRVLPQALAAVSTNGIIITIAFHQGEDKIAKQYFANWQKINLGQKITKKPITATLTEVQNNPNARSAKMRIFKKN